jgi:hypothetical protein
MKIETFFRPGTLLALFEQLLFSPKQSPACGEPAMLLEHYLVVIGFAGFVSVHSPPCVPSVGLIRFGCNDINAVLARKNVGGCACQPRPFFGRL